jgi:heparosan-N-sulfate-glucuronate 5-epimerase
MKPESLDFSPLNCSLEARLGDYYQDFSSATRLVESGYFGALDRSGLPRSANGDSNPIIVAQYALANLISHGRGEPGRGERARAQLDWLVSNQEEGGEFAGTWIQPEDNLKYPWLRTPWISALASGNAISALLRGWEAFDRDSYRSSAEAAVRALHAARPRLQLWREDGVDLWYEEYPAEPSLKVLNGHIYTLLGVLDYARATDDQPAWSRWSRAAATTLAHLDEFDLGYWSAYELRWREPAALHYQKNIHVPQLRVLAALTGEQGFTEVADRWQRYLESPLCRLRWMAALRLRRFQRRDVPTA